MIPASSIVYELERQIEEAGERPPEEDAVQRSALQAFLEEKYGIVGNL